MENERIINGKRCRLFYGLWIADTGDFVARYNEDSGCYESCTIYPTINLGACVEEMDYELSFDETIADLFGPPYPHDGKSYSLIHKDGNEMNCDYRNLEWRDMEHLPRFPFHSNKAIAPKVFLRYYHWIFEVHSSGIIKYDGKVLRQYDLDPALDEPLLEICIDAGYYIARVDEIMSRAGFVQGDINNFKSPVILHRDGDYKNFASDNLEWVEETDPRFIRYMEKKQQAQQARIKELIGQGLLSPDWDSCMPPVSPHKPIQLPPVLFTPPDYNDFAEAHGPIVWERIKQNFDPITGQPIVPQISSSLENPPAPFTPPDFSSFGETPGVGDNPFKPIKE